MSLSQDPLSKWKTQSSNPIQPQIANEAQSDPLSKWKQQPEEKAQEEQPSGFRRASRNVMQGVIGGVKGQIYRNPLALVADVAFPGAVANSILENKELFGNDPELPKFNQEEVVKSANEFENKFLGKEGFVTGLLTLPLRAFGVETEPKNAEEAIIRNGTMLLTGIKGAQNATKGNNPFGLLPASAKEQAKDLGKMTTLSFAASAFGQMGETVFGTPGRIMADLIAFGSMGAYKQIKEWYNNFPKDKFSLAGETFQTEAQKALTKPYLDIAKKHDIPVSIGTVSDSAFVKAVENNIAKNNLTGKSAQEFRNNSAERWGGLYGEFLSETEGAAAYESSGAVAQKLRESVINPLEKQITEKAKQLYTEAEAGFANAAPISSEGHQKIEDSLNDVFSKVSKSLLPTSAEAETQNLAQRGKGILYKTPSQAGRPELEDVKYQVGTAENLLTKQSQQELAAAPGQKKMMQAQARKTRAKEVTKEELRKAELAKDKLFGKDADKVIVDENGRLKFKKDIRPDEMIATIRSLNDKISWDKPEVINLFKPVKSTIRNVLKDEYKNTHPNALNSYDLANQEYGRGAKLFYGDRAKFKKWAINSDTTPESLANELNSIDKFKQFEQQFGNKEEGKKLIEYIKRKKLDNVLQGTFDQATLNYSPGMIRGKIEPLKRNQFVKYLAGDNWSKFEEIAKLDKFISENATKIYSSGIPQETLSGFLGQIKMGLSLLSPGTAATATGVGIISGKIRKDFVTDIAKLYSSPELMKEAIEIAKHSNDWSKNPSYWTARMQQHSQNIKLMSEESNLINQVSQ